MQKRKLTVMRIARIGVFTAMALIMHVIESMLPPLLAFAPGAKIGLSNVVTLSAIILLGYIDAGIVLVVRCLLSSLYGNVFSLIYSLGGGVAAYICMSLLYRFVYPRVSIIGISVSGAVIHNVVQTLIAATIVNQINLILILPLMLTASCAAGVFIGATVFYLIKYLPLERFLREPQKVSGEQVEKIFEAKPDKNNPVS